MICFAWHGFPQYAARCVGVFVKEAQERVVVVATRPNVPIEGMEKAAGCEVVWIDGDDDLRGIEALCGELPRVLFVSGWGTAAFNRYRDEVRAKGGKVIAMSDNNFQLSLRECVKALRFRLRFRNKYDGYFVPGMSGKRLLKFYGVPSAKIRQGMYSADETLFVNGVSAEKREKKILFVGQLNGRKNIVPFARAFLAVNAKRGWTLEICGCGPDREALLRIGDGRKGLVVHDFVQPEALAKIYQSARVFALPSIEEHWGLVVHEAALSGCVLLLSNRIGAGEDFLGLENGVVFNPYSMKGMGVAIEKVMEMSDEEVARASAESVQLGNIINKRLFVNGVKGFSS